MLSFLGIENARGARMLEGWFCRARKKLKQSNSSNSSRPNTKELDVRKVDGDPNSRDERILHRPDDIDQSEEASCTTSSNFASLLSAAKSELGMNSHRSSPYLQAASQQPINVSRLPREEDHLVIPGSQDAQQAHKTVPPLRAVKSELGGNSYQSSPHWDDSQPFGKAASYQPIKVSVMKGSKKQQQIQMPKPHCIPHGFKPDAGISNTFRNLGEREEAILSSFQSLQSVEIHDRPSAVEHPFYHHQQGQQGAPLTEYPPFQQSQGQQDSPPAAYSSHQHSQCHQQDHQQAPAANYSSYQNLQGQQQPPTAKYPTYQPLPGHQQQVHSSECPPYQHRHHGSPDTEYPSYQHPQGQRRASPIEYSAYQQSHCQHQAYLSDNSPYQHSQRQRQVPPVDYSSQDREYNGYARPSSNPSSLNGDPNGSHPQGSGFHQEHMAYEQNPNPTYQH